MITDPKTIPIGRHRPPRVRGRGRAARDAADRAADDRVRARRSRCSTALALVCAAARRATARRRESDRLLSGATRPRRLVVGTRGSRRRARVRRPRRRPPESRLVRRRTRVRPRADVQRLYRRSRSSTPAGSPRIDAGLAQTIAPRRRRRSPRRVRSRCAPETSSGPTRGASGPWLASLWQRIGSSAGRPVVVASYQLERMQLSLRRGAYQGPPTVVARIEGTMRHVDVCADAAPGRQPARADALQADARARARAGTLRRSCARRRPRPAAHRHPHRRRAARPRSGGISLENVADKVGLALHAGRVPLRRLARHDGDDGWRPLLAGLRQRRLARPLRRQLVRRRRHRSLGGRAAAFPEARSTTTSEGRFVDVSRAPAPTSPCAETVAWRPTSTSTVTPIST